VVSTPIKPVVDIGIACNIYQSFQFWTGLVELILSEERAGNIIIGKIRAIGSALPDHNKNSIVGNVVKRLSLTDANRQEITKGFLDDGADYLFWMDDDTVPPQLAISTLVKSGHEFIAGVYYMPSETCYPIAYKREKSNLYSPVYKYPIGALLEVDAVGFGCTLTKRSVFEKIMAGHTVYVRYDGTLLPMPNDKIFEGNAPVNLAPMIKDGVYMESVRKQSDDENDKRPFPFFALENGRTEDYYFCELAEHVGVKPYLDTTVQCSHWKLGATTIDNYKKLIYESENIL